MKLEREVVTANSGQVSLIARILAMAALLLLVLAGAPGQASAHEGEEGTEAFQFVRQAIALIVNTPDDLEAIAEKISDAVEAPDDHGVDIALVEQAGAALEIGDLHGTRTLLERSIGAAPHLGPEDPVAAGEHVGDEVGEEVGEEAEGEQTDGPYLDPLDTSRDISGGDLVVLAGAFALIVVGGVLARSLRPTKEVTT